jgi:hypothetical protein
MGVLRSLVTGKEQRFRVFEIMVLKMYEPRGRKLYNEELHNLYSSAVFFRVIK